MRFSKLELLKYGRFDGCTFVFPSGPPDLHVISGPNEIGKSTAMAAIGDFLFGFGNVTPYDFVHDKHLLRVGAVLNRGASELQGRRKKGRSATLLDESENPIDEGLLATFLGGYTRDNFHRMFSLDHDRLREGGTAMLEAKDDVGQAIFAAGSGLLGISQTLSGLQSEIKAIWTKRVGNTDFHNAQRAFADAQSRFQAAKIKPAAWDQLRKELQQTDSSLVELRDERRSKETERDHVERRRRALAPIALLRQFELEMHALADTPDMPADADETLREATREIEVANTELTLVQDQIGTMEAGLNRIELNESILEQREGIEALREAKGAIDKSLLDIPRRNTELKLAQDKLHELQIELGWHDEAAKETKERLPKQVAIAELRALLEERATLDAVLQSATEDDDLSSELLGEAKQNLEEVADEVDTSSISSALQVAQAHGDIDATCAAALRTLTRRKQELDIAIAQLAPWVGSAAELQRLVLPSDVEISDAGAKLLNAEEEATKERRERNSESDRTESLELQRQQLLVGDEAVSPKSLQDARERRDSSWTDIHGGILDGSASKNVAAIEDFANKIAIADRLADQRYLAAQQSGRLAATIDELERSQLALSQKEARIVTADSHLQEIKSIWNERMLGSSLDMTPKQLLSWIVKEKQALTAIAEHRDAQEVYEEEVGKRRDTVTLLSEAIRTIEVDFIFDDTDAYSTLVAKAQQLKLDADQIENRRIQAKASVTSATTGAARAAKKKAAAQAKLEEWQERWGPAVRSSGLNAVGSIAVIRAQVGLLDETRGTIDDILNLQRRIETMEGDVTAFNEKIATISALCNMAKAEGDASQTLSTLTSELELAATLSERRAGIASQILDAEARKEKANTEKLIAESRLAPLMELTEAADYKSLAPIVANSQLVRSLKDKIAKQTESLVLLGEGLSLEEILLESEGADSDSLKARHDDLQEELRVIAGQIETLMSNKTTAQIAFDALDDGPKAATAAADMEIARTEMTTHSERYLRKRAQATLLEWSIERYRAERQNPLLKRASELFQILTLGRYTSLLVDTEDSDSHISAVTLNGSVVPVNGMSEGTRDQLFLAMRIAAVEGVVAGGVKLPFLADDLFINFDDRRADAGFRVLAELAKTTQVLFFTHHDHLLPIARAALSPYVLSECTIQ